MAVLINLEFVISIVEKNKFRDLSELEAVKIFIHELVNEGWEDIDREVSVESGSIDLIGKNKEDHKVAFEFKSIKSPKSYENWITEIASYRIAAGSYEIDRWVLVLINGGQLPTTRKDRLRNLVKTNNMDLWEFDLYENGIREILILEEVDDLLESEEILLIDLKLIIGKEQLAIIQDKIKAKEIKVDDIRSVVINSYAKGLEIGERESEKSDLISAFFGDFLMGGFVAGGVFTIIDSIRFDDAWGIFLGIGLIVLGIIPWVYIYFKKPEFILPER
jgi:hypothetical protein